MASARFGTSFHKRNATGEAVQSLQTYIESITAKPEISFIDYDWGIYDYRARFAGDTSFRIDVIESNGGYLVTGFRPEGR
ncbi:MAG: hypothetical protein ACYSYT_07980 [Planctomycetota bacterium]